MERSLFVRAATAFLTLGLAMAGCSDDGETPLQPDESEIVNDNLIRIVAGPGNWVVDAEGNEVTDPDGLLWFRDPFIPDAPINPLLAPDDDQVTLSEFTAVEGQLRVKCTDEGTQLSGEFSDLFPNGVYTLWLALWNEPIGTDPSNIFRGLFAVGAVGPQDGSENAFQASGNGEGQVSLTITAGPLTFVPGEVEDDCLFDDPSVAQWHIVGAYHVDGQTHGGQPGPRVEPFLFIFDN